MKNTHIPLHDLDVNAEENTSYEINTLFLQIAEEIKGRAKKGVNNVLGGLRRSGEKQGIEIDRQLGKVLGLSSYKLSELARRDEADYYNALAA